MNNLAYNDVTPSSSCQYIGKGGKEAAVIDHKDEIKLTTEQEKEFTKGFKIGILKQLHKKKLLTDKQLNQLIAMQK